MLQLPSDPRYYTEATAECVRVLLREFPTIGSFGIYNRRRINSSSTNPGWSQHAWGNAVDLTSPRWMLKPPLYAPPSAESLPQYKQHFDYMDDVAAYLRTYSGDLSVRNLLWRRYLHRNHIHVDFNPKQRGTPPIIGDNEEMQVKELVTEFQQTLNAAGVTDDDGQALDEDGVVGPRTRQALAKVFRGSQEAGQQLQLELETIEVVSGARLVP